MEDNTILQIIFTVALSIVIAFFAYFLLIHFVVDAGPADLNGVLPRVKTVLDFYEQRHDGDIFIIGSSLVDGGIDAEVVEDLLQKRLVNRSVYNLAIAGDTPFDRLCEIDNIITSKPKMVVIGLSYRELSNTSINNEDRLVLCSQRNQIHEEIQYFYNDNELKLMSQTPFEYILYKRKYLIYSVIQRGQGLSFNRDTSSVGKNEVVVNEIKIDVNETKIDVISQDLNPQKKALLYSIERLQKNNISVIIINMPLNPDYSSMINESSRHNLSNFLNSTGVPWYDYEREYASVNFRDYGHLTIAGRTNFSPKVATILADNLIKGA